MNVCIVAVGKIKETYLENAIADYLNGLKRYCSVEVIEIKDERTPDRASDKEEAIIKQLEGDRILSRISDNQYVITLEIEGKMLTSKTFLSTLKKIPRGKDIVFVIGGSLGLSVDVIERSNYAISFSKMTFPHQLMRVILLEQLYRCGPHIS
ncbi:MAG: 23S rRNA (pseudouridine(1915)-N(3))-methyltransferase RlmH [Vallitaleaceae bacterium]|jgi:23S rRNA (pseudouridine1915-N3)-methyltransferase|nr:23S rRNA (pseudouridine(1915)-N(3))-methyltransferase RlmH [Vallitaleaceae bacterium]